MTYLDQSDGALARLLYFKDAVTTDHGDNPPTHLCRRISSPPFNFHLHLASTLWIRMIPTRPPIRTTASISVVHTSKKIWDFWRMY
ncbi:unnamed protein product [Periconia digitata]|uniref:Uncharacterized protein n=1 Tax=Periconia digitata TaxID=1303443 RepID=A0A9W4XWE5_9PLEO|nr:unnamed protein product [Periconia digitata]